MKIDAVEKPFVLDAFVPLAIMSEPCRNMPGADDKGPNQSISSMAQMPAGISFRFGSLLLVAA